jgi:alkylhydroperoxidase/carboxymuconolactone decarboxylase family protein YurZ
MPEHPLKPIEDNDPDLMGLVRQATQLEFSDGALSKKTKILIALAIDASLGAPGGVRALAQQALAAGATRDEIMETIRVVHFVGGQAKLHCAAEGLKGVL